MIYLNGIIAIILYYSICIWALYQDDSTGVRIKKLIKELSFVQTITIILLILFSLELVLYWRLQDLFIPNWDWAKYWELSIVRSQYMSEHNMIDVIKSLILSINFEDYNQFIPTIMALPLKMTGTSYPAYTFVTQLLFLFPSVFVMALATLKLADTRNKSKLFTFSVFIALILPMNYYTLLRGYIDVAALMPFSILIYLFIDYDFNKTSFKKNSAIGLMFLIAWVTRRYLIYFIIGYVIALMIKALINLVEDRCFKNTKNIIISFATIGISSLGTLLLFCNQFVMHALKTNYAEIYSAFNLPLIDKIKDLNYSFGYLCLIVTIISGIFCFICKKNRTNYVCMLTIMLSETALFFMTQSMNWHHRIILNVPLFMVIMMLFSINYKDLKNKIEKYILITIQTGCFLLFLLNFDYSLIKIPTIHKPIDFFAERYFPVRRNDIQELHNMVDDLNNLTKNGEKHVYILASSGLINRDLILKINMPYDLESVKNLLLNSDVDLRDGFRPEFFEADYIVTTNPIQTHLPSGQEVVTYLSANLQDANSYIGKHFIEIKNYKLDNNIDAKIYEKISDWTQDDIDEIKAYYDNLYPTHKDLFADRIQLRTKQEIKNDQ